MWECAHITQVWVCLGVYACDSSMDVYLGMCMCDRCMVVFGCVGM